MDTLLFDFWGTLAYLDEGEDFVDKIAVSLGISRENYTDFVIKVWYKENLTPEKFAVRLTNEFGRVPKSPLVNLLLSPLKRVKLYPDAIPNLDRLVRKYKLALVSDTTPIGKECANIVCIDDYFEDTFFSCDYGITKKEGLYGRVLRELKLEPSACVIIGNSMDSDYSLAERLKVRAILMDRADKQKGVRKIKELGELT